jgi:hypothetical protein
MILEMKCWQVLCKAELFTQKSGGSHMQITNVFLEVMVYKGPSFLSFHTWLGAVLHILDPGFK